MAQHLTRLRTTTYHTHHTGQNRFDNQHKEGEPAGFRGSGSGFISGFACFLLRLLFQLIVFLTRLLIAFLCLIDNLFRFGVGFPVRALMIFFSASRSAACRVS